MARRTDIHDWRVWLGVVGVFVIGGMVWNGLQQPSAELVDWQSDPGLLAGSSDPQRPLTLVQFTSPHCPPCRQMAARVFTKSSVADATRSFVCVRLGLNEHEDAAARFHVAAVPTFLVLDPKGGVVATRLGFMPAYEFVLFLESARKTFASASRSAARR